MIQQDIRLHEGSLFLVLRVREDGDVLLLHCSTEPFDPDSIPEHTLCWYRLVELQTAGENQNDHHGNKHTGTSPGSRLCYVSHTVTPTTVGSVLCVTLRCELLEVRYIMELFPDACTVRTHTEVTCIADHDVCLTYLSIFALTGLTKGLPDPSADVLVSWAYNSWCSELQWQRSDLNRLGLSPISDIQTLRQPEQYQNFSLQTASFCGRGTWPCSEYLPMGAIEHTQKNHALAWQIETGGPWQWELSTIAGEYYLQLAGPDDERHHWMLPLAPGEHYTTGYAAIAFASAREEAFAQLTAYRRHIMRPCRDTRELPVIFNDYMALLGDPDEASLLPLIDAAAEIGAEYFCIDSGWYADGSWWDCVGFWQPASRRFPHGLPYVMQYIRDHGMIPGLWLEPEVMGIHCPLAADWPDECFFLRGGRRVIDHGRYQLDFRHPIVRAHADEVIDRLAGKYRIGYLKLDYNINGGYGTEFEAPSAGVGLERHQRAYRAWLSDVQKRWPDLVIENCASGGMRMEYGLLSQLSIQSLSDQDEAVKLAPIAAAAPSAVTPEQAAVWSLPAADASDEELIFSMVSTLLLRIHQSGPLNDFSPAKRALLSEAIALYKTYRRDLAHAVPLWPLGLPAPDDALLCLAMDPGDRILLALWRIRDEKTVCHVPLPRVFAHAAQIYPAGIPYPCRLTEDGQTLLATLPPAPSARLYELRGREDESAQT